MKQSQGGLGIGLALVKRLVEIHGGTIAAKSDGLSTGSEFIISLPVVTEAREMGKSLGGNIRSTTGSLRVVVVDDNRDNADTLAQLLAANGHQVRIAYDGEEAIQAAVEYQPEVILLDLGLPTMDGCDVCRIIRQSRGRSNRSSSLKQGGGKRTTAGGRKTLALIIT